MSEARLHLRQFHFSLRAMLILTALIAAIWGVAAQWPVECVIERKNTLQNLAGKFRNHTEFVMEQRPPTAGEAARRAVPWSVLVVLASCLADQARQTIWQRKKQPRQHPTKPSYRQAT